MKRKIYIKLIGGIGNQLFQYSCAKNLSIELDSDLIIDDKSGFFFDKHFKREKSLPKNLKYSKISLLDLLFFNILILIKKIIFKNKIYFNFGNIILVDESISNEYIIDLKEKINKYNKVFLLGFFQSEKYFLENKSTILSEILDNKIENPKLENIKNEINKDSLLLGIRMFEEAPAFIKKNFGGIEDYSFYKNSIKLFNIINELKIYVFTTLKDKSQITDNIDKNLRIIGDEYRINKNDLDFILLMSNFENFIISNSTFYWWGTYLAEYKKKIKVISSNKFRNKSTVPSRWKNLN
tara:strand:+ start:156 stop:1040 length:885 start_codon:yes stop_codon:yes gene_type:complete